MDTIYTEITIIGGGLAGSSLASTLAKHGHDVVLLEKTSFPRDKLCGEFLSPESSRLLAKLDCLADLHAHQPAEITKARFSTPDNRLLGSLLNLDLPAPALGLSRLVLDETLFKAAERHGATTFCDAKVRTIERSKSGQFTIRARLGSESITIKSPLVVAAYGRRTRLDRTLERRARADKSPRSQLVAFKQHHRPCENYDGDELKKTLRNHVEIHTFDGGYCGLNFVESGTVNVCTLFDSRLLNEVKKPRWPQISALLSTKNRHLAYRLEALQPLETPMQAVAQLSLRLKERHHDGVLFVGDAASMIAPLVGDGQAMALESGIQLGELIHRHFPVIPARAWEWQWRRNFEIRLRLGQILQTLALQPVWAAGALGAAASLPALRNMLVRRTRG